MTTYKERHRPWVFQILWFTSLGAIAYGLWLCQAWQWYLTRELFGYPTHLEISVLCGLYLVWDLLSVVLHLCMKRDQPTHDQIFGNRYTTQNDTICIIPCHKAATTIHKTIEAALLSFPPTRIVISDNANTLQPPDHTKEVADAYQVKYLYTPKGNKTTAMLQAYLHMGRGARYVVLLDDDTILPENFAVRADLFRDNPRMGGHSCNICVAQEGCNACQRGFNVITRLVDFEYLSFCWQANVCSYYATQRFAQGIIAVYTALCFETVYSQLRMLDGEPFSDDASAGIVARRCGFVLGQDQTTLVQTFAPGTILCGSRSQGFGASSLFRQRARRCNLSWLRRAHLETALLLHYDTGSVWGNIYYRLCHIHQSFLQCASLLWPAFLVKISLTPGIGWVGWGRLHGAIFSTGAISASVRNLFFPHKVAWWVPLLSPCLSGLNSIFYLWAFFETLMWYIPFKRPRSRKLKSQSD
jgi:glycosyltransferase involved in cell wall biosynthesis